MRMENFKEGSLSDYKYDLVTAITADAVNGALKQYLATVNKAKKIYVLKAESCYYEVQEGKLCTDIPEIFPEEVRELGKIEGALYKEIENLQLFAEDVSEEALAKAYDELYVSYGIYAEYGLPQCFIPEDIETYQILEFEPTLDANNSYVQYHLCFKNIKILEISEEHRKLKYRCSVQPKQGGKENAWKFLYKFNINFKGDLYENLPKQVKKKVKLLGNRVLERKRTCERIQLQENATSVCECPFVQQISYNSMNDVFDISKLIMILESRTALTTPKISGLSEEVSDYVNRIFMRYFFDDLERDGQTIFSYILAPKPGEDTYLFAPKNFTLTVNNPTFGKVEYNPGLTTLNYIVMCDDMQIPELKIFQWVWVTPSEHEHIHGIMEINRDLLFGRLCELFQKEVLSKLHMQVDAWMEKQTVGFKYWIKLTTSQQGDRSWFQLQSDGTYKYVYEDKKVTDTIYGWIPPCFAASGSLGVKYSVECNARAGDVVVDGKTYSGIIFDTRVVGWLDVVYNLGHSKGTIFDSNLIFGLGITIKEDGELSFQKTFEKRDNALTIDKSGWAEFSSFGGIDDTIDNFKNFLIDYIKPLTNFAESRFLDTFFTNVEWVMPGNTTFTFKNEGFTKGQDYYTQVTYVQE